MFNINNNKKKEQRRKEVLLSLAVLQLGFGDISSKIGVTLIYFALLTWRLRLSFFQGSISHTLATSKVMLPSPALSDHMCSQLHLLKRILQNCTAKNVSVR